MILVQNGLVLIFEPIPHTNWDLPDISGRTDLNFGIMFFFEILALEFSGLSALILELDPLFSRFLGSRQMDVRNIFWRPDMDSPHRVSMDEPIFKPLGQTIVHVMTILFPNPNYFAQSWRGHLLDSHNPTFNVFGPNMADSFLFRMHH